MQFMISYAFHPEDRDVVQERFKTTGGGPGEGVTMEGRLDWEGARYFEGGGQNVGLEDLVVNHVEPEAELGLRLGFSNIETHFEGNFAWALVDTEIRLTTADGRPIHNRGHGTYLFRWVDGAWRVVHTQSGSSPVRSAGAGTQ